MNKYYLDVITGAEGTTGLGVNKSWGGTKNYVIKATNYAVDADTYIFWNQEQKVDVGLNRVRFFPQQMSPSLTRGVRLQTTSSTRLTRRPSESVGLTIPSKYKSCGLGRIPKFELD